MDGGFNEPTIARLDQTKARASEVLRCSRLSLCLSTLVVGRSADAVVKPPEHIEAWGAALCSRSNEIDLIRSTAGGCIVRRCGS